MKTNFKNIYSDIKDKLNINIQSGYSRDDFMSNYITYRLKIKSPDSKVTLVLYNKFTSEFMNNIHPIVFTHIINLLSMEISKAYWRLNNKRIRHNLKSWI